MIILYAFYVAGSEKNGSQSSARQHYRVGYQLEMRKEFVTFLYRWQEEQTCTQTVEYVMKKEESYISLNLHQKVSI